MAAAEPASPFQKIREKQSLHPPYLLPEFHDNGYRPYNMGYPPNAYPYSGTIPPATGTYYLVPAPYSQSTSILCIRGFIIFMILIIVAFFLAIFTTWLVMRPEVPVFKVEALSLSNFSTANSILVANFDVNFSMENPNRRLRAYFDDFQQAMYHKDDIILTSYSTPLELDTRQRCKLETVDEHWKLWIGWDGGGE